MNNKKPKHNKYVLGILGGLASMGASSLTHPLDTIKVHLQTQKKAKFGFIGITKQIIKNNGFLSLYNGMSAALLMSATYSSTRFGFYEFAKETLSKRSSNESGVSPKLPFYQKIIIAGLAGGLGAIVGTPSDVINVRMQNDVKLPAEQRRNYKHVFEAMYRISKTEGISRLYVGFMMATIRSVLVTIGQLAFYDEIKTRLVQTKYFKDNLFTHFTASVGCGLIATFITMPADVVKTLLMNARPGELRGIFQTAKEVLEIDKLGLFKGFWPRYIRLGPFTVICFVFYEKLKLLSTFAKQHLA